MLEVRVSDTEGGACFFSFDIVLAARKSDLKVFTNLACDISEKCVWSSQLVRRYIYKMITIEVENSCVLEIDRDTLYISYLYL